MTWANYLIQVNIYLVLFYIFYTVLLRNETFFSLNRIYLISSGALSFLIPLMQSDLIRSLFVNEKVYQAATITMIYVVPTREAQAESPEIPWILVIYLTGALISLTRLLIQLSLLTGKEKKGGEQPYSFFRKIVIPDNLPGREFILKHEKVHARQWHSADVILFEIIAVITWFNPVIYLYKKAIRYIHEFIADESAALNAGSKSDYSLLLLSNVFGVAPSRLSNNFFNQSLLKKRIVMLQKSKSAKVALVKYGLSVPLFFSMIIFSSAAIGRKETVEKIKKEISTLATGEHQTITQPEKVQVALPRSDDKALGALYKSLSRKIVYPSAARTNTIQGDVVCRFTISSSGSVENVGVLSSPGYGTSEVVKAALQKTTGLASDLSGKYVLRICFRLNGQDYVPGQKPLTLPAGYKDLSSMMIVGYPSSDDKAAQKSEGLANDNSIHDFASIDKMPDFPGGIQTFYQYVAKNYRFPDEARKNNITGRLILSFVVEKDGSLSDIKALRDLGYGTGDEAIRMLKEGPKWEPGMNAGQPIRVQYTLPIMLNLNNNSVILRGNVMGAEQALYIIDGKEKTYDELKAIDAKDIQSINVLKDAASTEKYGEKGKNGVIIVVTKKNSK